MFVTYLYCIVCFPPFSLSTLSYLERNQYTKNLLKEWRSTFHFIEVEYPCKLSRILLHRKVVYSPSFVYFFFNHLWTHGTSFYTLGNNLILLCLFCSKHFNFDNWGLYQLTHLISRPSPKTRHFPDEPWFLLLKNLIGTESRVCLLLPEVLGGLI